MGGLEDPPADELVVDEADPVAEPVHLLRGRQAPRVLGLDLVARARPTGEVAHHLGIGVELDLPLEVLVGERQQGKPLRVQGLLRDAPDHARAYGCLVTFAGARQCIEAVVAPAPLRAD